MKYKVFLSYRRKDDPSGASLIFQALDRAFPAQVFMDTEGGIGLGKNFVTAIENAVAQSEHVLVVIGPNWVTAKDERGRRRLDDSNDFVRLEVESGLKQGKTVVPVLINDVPMPSPKDLPQSIKELAYLNAVKIRTERFRDDVAVLVRGLGGDANGTPAGISNLAPQNADEAVRQLELSRWQALGDNPAPGPLRNFVKQFPHGIYHAVAKIKLEEMAWEKLPRIPKPAQIEQFLKEFPDGAYSDRARQLKENRKTYSEKQVKSFWATLIFGGFASAMFAGAVLGNFRGGNIPLPAVLFAFSPAIALVFLYIARRKMRRRSLLVRP